MTLTFRIFCIVCTLYLLTTQQTIADDHSPARVFDAAQFDQWMNNNSNWGRWGKTDERGALNLITTKERVAAATLVQSGSVVSLARVMSTVKEVDNPTPLLHTMDETGTRGEHDSATDTYSVHYHGLGHTHHDALCHMFHNGKMYNGYSKLIVTEDGCEKNSILAIKKGIFTRGVLIDIPWLRGEKFLKPGSAIYAQELELWEKTTGINIRSGDVLLVRTGRWLARQQTGVIDLKSGMAGLHASTINWLYSRNVAAIGSDGITDVVPSGYAKELAPLHKLIIVGLGATLFDNLDLDELSQTAQEHKRWEFLFTTTPLAVDRGTGSPINPIAVF
jgi:kynurenine formamidase